jgi:hypothetical protein
MGDLDPVSRDRMRNGSPAPRCTYDPGMTFSLRRQRIMVMLGFITVALGWIGYVVFIVQDERSPWPDLEPASIMFGVGSVLGYAVLALASWYWFKWMETLTLQLAGLVRVLRLFAVGTAFIAGGLASIGYFWASHTVRQSYDGRTSVAVAVSYGLEFFGFLLAAIAYWDTAAHLRTSRPPQSTTGTDLLTA